MQDGTNGNSITLEKNNTAADSMKIVFVTEYPYSFNSNGAAAFSSSHLRTLIKLDLFEKITVVYIGAGNIYWEDEGEFRKLPEVKIIHRDSPVQFKRTTLAKALLNRVKRNDFDHLVSTAFDYSGSLHIQDMMQQIIDDEKPDYLWAEHLQPLLLLNRLKATGIKIIYSHHDFLFKILRIKRGLIKDRVRSFHIRQVELLLLKKIQLFVSGSLTEINYAKKWMNNNQQFFCPCIYPEPAVKKNVGSRGTIPRIIHFGTIAATANKIGIHHLFTTILPALRKQSFELHFVGNVQEYILKNFAEELKYHQVVFHGFVEDPSSCFQPYDIHIIPYKGYSGTRTRVGSISRFKPCIAGYENLLDNYPFLKNKRNALIAASDDEMIALLKDAIDNNDIRIQTGDCILNDLAEFDSKLSSEISTTLIRLANKEQKVV